MIKKLEYWLKSKEQLFDDFKCFTLDYGNLVKNRIFIDRKADILFVAHIDTVQKPQFIRKTKRRVYSSGLDDRLGCLLAYELSQELNIDLLICDNEERMQSTGQFHDLKDYNWIVEFDRAGNDVVTYDLDNKEFLSILSEYWKVGIGAFSDICQLNTKSCCFNLGIGYQLSHSKASYVVLKVLRQQIDKFKQFHAKYKDTKFVQNPKIDKYDRYDDYYDYTNYSRYGECELCGLSGDVEYVFGHIVCQDCFEDMYNQYCTLIWN